MRGVTVRVVGGGSAGVGVAAGGAWPAASWVKVACIVRVAWEVTGPLVTIDGHVTVPLSFRTPVVHVPPVVSVRRPGHVVGVRQHLFDQPPHMGIVGHVVDPGAVTAGPDQAGQSELGQVLGDPGRMGSHELRQLVDRVLGRPAGPR
jgi:hypothetical protein